MVAYGGPRARCAPLFHELSEAAEDQLYEDLQQERAGELGAETKLLFSNAPRINFIYCIQIYKVSRA